ncbi:MAG: hypothetical protein QG656_531 [Candidatus Hydrogenedentes bacterium]|nr:hypothetical protein [Candidatus Hydrogenedentota bacterium]
MPSQCNRRTFLKSLGAAALVLPVCGNAFALEPAAKKRPNVLFLFADDQRFSTLHALNNPDIQTPNLDRLARNGVAFTHAHIMGSMSGAVCMPSRAMLMSGRTLFHLEKDGQTIPPEHEILPETFRKAGYTTFGTGKWHNSPAAYARGFTHGGNIFFGGMWNHLEVPVFDFDPEGKYPKEKRHIGGKFSSELFSDTAIEFIETCPNDTPFFLYVAYMAPHDPRMAPKEYADLYPPEKVALPPNFLPEHPFDNGELHIRDEELAKFPRTPEIVREHLAAYYAMITHLDAHIGRVLDALEASGRADDTIVVFAADNGLAVGQHGLLGKQNLYDHSARVPLIIGGPGLPKGETRDGLCYLLDVYPSLCELAGLDIPASVDGKSLAPMLRDPKAAGRESVHLAYRDFQRGVRQGDYKLIEYAVNGQRTTQLFNIEADPWELTNLANDPAHAETVTRLRTELRRWRNEFGDPSPFWDTVPG